ncbi:MAG: NAD-dependent epimerase/dehydratase family protein [Candidatus Anstonellaceae archaeon]
MRVLVTGGAGFIGSHIVDVLVEEKNKVLILDNFISGKKNYINKKAMFVFKDIRKPIEKISKADAVFHFAADPDVRNSSKNPLNSFNTNVIGTYNVLEFCRKNDVKRFVFASTSTVYGEAKILPTPETYPLEPISNYGASKLAGEAYVCSYAHTYGIKSTILRYANIFGERSTHGVVYDFFFKLKKNPKKLEILGNGLQEKSYLYVSDAVNATILAWKKQKKIIEIFNVGSEKKYTVDKIAKIVCKELNVSPSFCYTGGERGWIGDVRSMLLDVSKIKHIGWKEKVSLEKGIKKYIKWLREEYG